VSQSSAVESYPSDTYQGESKPTLSPGENPPAERTYYESDKPSPNNGSSDVHPEPQDGQSDDSASFMEAPRLFNPKDQTALGNAAAPVRTAIYHKPVAGGRLTVRNISVSRHQALEDAEGWTSVSE
jgi:hypothetical protein